MFARLSFTDFNGQSFMKEYKKKNILDNELIKNFAPKVVEGAYKLKKWSDTL